MFLRHREGRYLDLMERTLYNGFLAGVSIAGDRFFYQNPLTSYGNYERFDWITSRAVRRTSFACWHHWAVTSMPGKPTIRRST